MRRLTCHLPHEVIFDIATPRNSLTLNVFWTIGWSKSEIVCYVKQTTDHFMKQAHELLIVIQLSTIWLTVYLTASSILQ
jgi:hypothetical protein